MLKSKIAPTARNLPALPKGQGKWYALNSIKRQRREITNPKRIFHQNQFYIFSKMLCIHPEKISFYDVLPDF